MLTTRFSVKGASLELLRSHETGMIKYINTLCSATAQKLHELGLSPGQLIVVEQRSPQFIVRVGHNRHILDAAAVKAIYVRIVS